IRLGVDQPVRGRVELERHAEAQRRLEPLPDERLARRLRPERDHAQRDLGSIAEERVADDAPARARDADEIAGRRADLRDVPAIDPRMAGARAILALARDGGGRHGYNQHSMRIAIGADHAGSPLKQPLLATLARLGHDVDDRGTHSDAAIDYPPI